MSFFATPFCSRKERYCATRSSACFLAEAASFAATFTSIASVATSGTASTLAVPEVTMCGPSGNSFACTDIAPKLTNAARAITLHFTVIPPCCEESPLTGRMPASLAGLLQLSIRERLVEQSLNMMNSLFRELESNKPHHYANQGIDDALRFRR